MSNSSQDRIAWVDHARGLGILLVIAGHALGGLIDSPLGGDFGAGRWLFFGIYTFHMPLFLMLSGLMVADRLAADTGKFRRSLWTSIAWPYFLWSTIQFSVIYLLGSLVNQPAANYWGTILQLPWHTVSQFWFLYALFLLHLLSLGLLGVAGRNGFLLICVVLKPLALTVALPDVLRLMANQALFYGIGVWLAPQGLQALIVDRALRTKFVVLAAAVIFLAVAYGAADSLDPSRQVGVAKAAAIANLSWRYEILPAAIGGSLAIIGIASLLSGRLAVWCAFLGRRTMPIFILHVMAIAGMRIALVRLAHVTEPWLVFGITAASGLIIPLVAYAIFRRFGMSRPLGLD